MLPFDPTDRNSGSQGSARGHGAADDDEPDTTVTRRDISSLPYPRLTLVHQGTSTDVTPPLFYLGRSRQQANYTLRDARVSRRHASIRFEDGVWWMVDEQSANGIHFEGHPVARRAIEDGDVFVIGDQYLLFTLMS